MKTLILEGSHPIDGQAARIQETLENELKARGWEFETIRLRDMKIGNCAGDFFCWVRTPGMCNTDDDNRLIAAKIINADLLVYLTPVIFGGYSSVLKKAVDHQIQNIAPFFSQINGETHHQPRYAKYPDLLVIGWVDTPDPKAEAIFRHLVYRNTINFYAKNSLCGLVTASQSDSELLAEVERWLDAIAQGTKAPQPVLPEICFSSAVSQPIRHALLLVGSPRTRNSTSNALGAYLLEQLAARGVETNTINVYTSLSSPEKMRLLLEKLDSSDLAVLAFPLYVDNLPAPVITLLERIAAHRLSHPMQTRFAAIVNCGFPEPDHNATAVAICNQFACQSGFNWAGSLALGAGEGLVHGVPLNQLDGRAIPLKKALELAADALSQGQPIPQAAQDLLVKPFVPAWMYRMIGGFGWKRQAKKYGAEKFLNRRTYVDEKILSQPHKTRS